MTHQMNRISEDLYECPECKRRISWPLDGKKEVLITGNEYAVHQWGVKGSVDVLYYGQPFDKWLAER